MFKRNKEPGEKIEDVIKEIEEQPRFDLFNSFELIQKRRSDVNILEISIRQGQIVIIFEKDLISLNAFKDLSKMAIQKTSSTLLPKYASIGFIGENTALVINTNSLQSDQFHFSNVFKVLHEAIEYAANNICKCPALEIVFSDQYIKCYLDKPGITLDDIEKYEKMFNLKGTLELFGQRPYLLLINDNFEE